MKNFTISLFMILSISILNAQNYQISFAGTGLSSVVDSVKIDNITKGTSKSIYGTDILNLMANTGINSLLHEEISNIYPNPMNDQTVLSFYSKKAGNALILITDISGRQIYKSNFYYTQGVQKNKISGLKQGIYSVFISGENYSYNAKLISINKTESNPIIEQIGLENVEKTVLQNKSASSLIDMLYSSGDTLVFTGYSGLNTSTATDVPEVNKTITFTFEAPLAIGDSYQGGIIAYILKYGDMGYIPGQTHGLIAAPSDQSTTLEWGCTTVLIDGANGTAIGTGNQNTIDIVANCTSPNTAALACSDLVIGAYSDWYLPSKEELNQLYLNKVAIGGFIDADYWCSTQYNISLPGTFSWALYFGSGYIGGSSKDIPESVRAVRSF